MKYFFYFFCQKKSIRVRIIRTFVWNFKTYLKSTDFYFDKLSLFNHSPTKFLRFSLKIRSLEVHSHLANSARNDTYFAKSKTTYFWFAPSSTPGTELLQTIPHPRTQRAGLVLGVARGGWPSQTEQACITIRTLGKRLISTFLPFSLELLVKWQFYSREVNAATTILIGT